MEAMGAGVYQQVTFPACVATFLISSFIGISGWNQLRKRSRMSTSLKWLFYISAITGNLYQITSLLIVPLYYTGIASIYDSYVASYVAGYLSHLMLMLCLLSTIVFRLEMTFRGTTFQMSFRSQFAFIFIIGTMFLMTCTVVIIALLSIVEALTAIFIILTLYVPMYIITASYAVHSFSRNLLHLAAIADRDRLVVATSRYLTCFVVAFSSTLMFYGYAYVTYHLMRDSDPVLHDTIRAVLFMMDQCINQMCLLLQYKFAEKHYQRCCRLPDRCCLWLIDRKVEKHKVGDELDDAVSGTEHSIASGQSTHIEVSPPMLGLVPVESISRSDDSKRRTQTTPVWTSTVSH